MKTSLLPLSLTLTLLVFAAGCATPRTERVYSEAHNGRTIRLHAGEVFTVTLPANPTTGYVWELQSVDTAVLATSSQVLYTPKEGGALGGGGTAAFTFRAIAPGRATVQMNYARPWEKGAAPARTFVLGVEVGG